MNEQELIDQYIKSKSLSWAPSTIKTESSRIRAHIVSIKEDPKVVYERLSKTMKPLSLKTTFIRLGEFYQWLLENGKAAGTKNPFKDFMDHNARLFKYSYTIERVDVSFEEARSRIEEGIIDLKIKTAALQLLEGGLRSCELKTIKSEGDIVIGKGGKQREIFLRRELKEFRFEGTYQQLYYALKKVGLKPHTLRKLCATNFGRQKDVQPIDLMEAFGWNDIETATSYLQPVVSEKRAAMFKKATKK